MSTDSSDRGFVDDYAVEWEEGLAKPHPLFHVWLAAFSHLQVNQVSIVSYISILFFFKFNEKWLGHKQKRHKSHKLTLHELH